MTTIAQTPTVEDLPAALSALLAESLREKPIERDAYVPEQIRARVYQMLRNAAVHPLSRLDRMVRDGLAADPRAAFCAADDVCDAAFDQLNDRRPSRVSLPESSYADHVTNGLVRARP